jgi:hypothetical protein
LSRLSVAPRCKTNYRVIRSAAATVLLFVLGQALVPVVGAQEPAGGDAAGEEAGGQALRVFLDCQSRFCNFDFYRREIPFVNYTRDREDAQVHLLITSQQTGAGGFLFTLDFIGREEFEGIEDRLETSTRANLAEEQVLSLVARQIKLGLMRYVARTPLADQIRVEYEQALGEQGVATPESDPWNFWVFRVRGNGSYFARELTDFLFVSGALSANRVTEDFKLLSSVSASYTENNFETSDTTTVTSTTESYDAAVFASWSVGEHWGIGGQGSVSRSSFSNEDLVVRLAPAIEYNLFPYSESTRRQLRFVYSVGLNVIDYIEETVFLKTEETLPDHRFQVALEVRQPWGSSRAAVEAVQLLNDPGKNRLVAEGGVDFRLFKGLALDVDFGIARIRDQINLEAGDATEEEILTRQRELQSDFEYNFRVGFSYTFGSIFSNVVNPRFGGSTRFFIREF